jgi:8-oxo-dGTP pyrophosphatase MutT (NUDIX family)
MQPQIGMREIVYENAYQQIYRVNVAFKDYRKEIFVLACGQRVGVVIVRGDEALLIRQYRLLVNDMAWEIPGGKVDDGETLEAAAHREAFEEAGVRCGILHPLLYFHPGLDTCDNPTFMFLTRPVEVLSTGSVDPLEETERVWVPLGKCLQMIFSGEIVDSLTVAALLALHIRQTHPEQATACSFEHLKNKRPNRGSL